MTRSVPVGLVAPPADVAAMERAIETALARRHWSVKEKAPGQVHRASRRAVTHRDGRDRLRRDERAHRLRRQHQPGLRKHPGRRGDPPQLQHLGEEPGERHQGVRGASPTAHRAGPAPAAQPPRQGDSSGSVRLRVRRSQVAWARETIDPSADLPVPAHRRGGDRLPGDLAGRDRPGRDRVPAVTPASPPRARDGARGGVPALAAARVRAAVRLHTHVGPAALQPARRRRVDARHSGT